MKRFAILAALFLSGCSFIPALNGDSASVKVIEYGASGLVTGSAVGGCEVLQSESKASAGGKGSMSITLRYAGQNCAVEAKSK